MNRLSQAGALDAPVAHTTCADQLPHFAQIVEKHQTLLRNTLRHRALPHGYEPEDIVQETFLSFYQHLTHSPSAECPDPKGLLFVMSGRVRWRLFKKQYSRKRRDDVTTASSQLRDFDENMIGGRTDDDPLGRALALDEWMFIKSKMINEEKFQIIDLLVQGYTLSEIAPMLNITNNEAHKRVRKVRRSLRALLELVDETE